MFRKYHLGWFSPASINLKLLRLLSTEPLPFVLFSKRWIFSHMSTESTYFIHRSILLLVECHFLCLPFSACLWCSSPHYLYRDDHHPPCWEQSAIEHHQSEHQWILPLHFLLLLRHTRAGCKVRYSSLFYTHFIHKEAQCLDANLLKSDRAAFTDLLTDGLTWF